MTKRTTGAAQVVASAPRRRSKSTDGAAAEQLPLLARMAADNVRMPAKPLTRSQALAAAPWQPQFPPAWERAFRAAYANRLEELGVSLPSAKSGKSGKGGKSDLQRMTLYLSAAEIEAQKRLARAAGESWSTWARRKLAT